jgi:hypothetical protein
MNDRVKSGALALFLLAGACVSPKTDRVKPAPKAQPVQVQSYPVTGLQTVIGRTARMLEAQFGRAEIDVREGTARKLQFSGPACVLDAYLYPPKAGGEPIVTHIDARLPDGRDMDRASCVAALTAARQVR